MNLETKITIYKFTPQVFTLTRYSLNVVFGNKKRLLPTLGKQPLICVLKHRYGISVAKVNNFKSPIQLYILKNIKNRTRVGVIPPYTIISWLLYSCVGIWFHELSASWVFLL